MFYGAGELYRLTGAQNTARCMNRRAATNSFGSGAFDSNYALLPWAASYVLEAQPVANDYLLGYFSGLGYRQDFRQIAVTDLANDANSAMASVANNYAHRNGRKLGFYPTWGQGTAVGEYVMRIAAKLSIDEKSPDEVQSYFNAMSLSPVDYVLGCNPNGLVWITGWVADSPEPLHLDALTFLKDGKGLLPGIPVLGPIVDNPGQSYYDYAKNVLYPSFMDYPGFHRYVDLRTFVSCNEFDLSIQARHAQLFSLIVAPGMVPSMDWFPGGRNIAITFAPRTALVPISRKCPKRSRSPP